MTENSSADIIILKILSGAQAGVEVFLRDGIYVLGSGPDDDIQLIDISLKPAHLKLKISGNKVQILGGEGSVKSRLGLFSDAGQDDWQEVEPLDVLTAGSSRFALGPQTAQWATIMEEGTPEENAPPSPTKKTKNAQVEEKPSFFSPWEYFGGALKPYRPLWEKWRPIALPSGGFLLVLLLSIFFLFGGSDEKTSPKLSKKDDLQVAQEILARFPFTKYVTLKSEVDGTLYATGYVQTPVQRRAILGAIEEAQSPLRARIYVLDSLKEEIDAIVKRDGKGVGYTISPDGKVVLEGLILDDNRVKKLITTLEEGVLGLKAVTSNIQTAQGLLQDIQRLARTSGVGKSVIFRTDGNIIEASGAVPSSEVDSWFSFLQAYSQRFAQKIGLRSYVQPVNDASIIVGRSALPAPDRAVTIGVKSAQSGSLPLIPQIDLDIQRLKNGGYNVKDVFAKSEGMTSSPPTGKAIAFSEISKKFSFVEDTKSETQPGFDPLLKGEFPRTLLGQTAHGLVKNWAGDRPSKQGSNLTKNLAEALDAVALSWEKGEALALNLTEEEKKRQRQALEKQLLPLFSSADSQVARRACWESSHLTSQNLPTILFWLDLLSVSDAMSLVSFEKEDQNLILEAALNPRKVEKCAASIMIEGSSLSLATRSLYLNEIKKNPDFIRFLIRDIQGPALEISGVNLGAEKFLQIRDGRKLKEGSAPNGATRIAYIGELGVSIQGKEGFSALIYDPRLNWLNK